ncbi:FtsB family cell division protein [Desulfobulbus alkaliphilus]|uniref:FtsB family cell division protein n=1 Tax=Desulfobulbus alkaliphilus TaxID=869814 RepID=UPI001962F5F9|nr:septum formation initiator family protein [Desulfobulbus alkaliphilus]MBM9536864.1 septum formation initiator family protein [Desulfobulbus alkaliphilus]
MNTVKRKKQEPIRHEKRKIVYLGVVIAVFLLIWILFAPERGYIQYRKLQKEITAMNLEVDRLEAKNIELAEEIKRLRSDDDYLEDIARKRHNLLKKNETVFEFDSGRARR